jgi:putative transposase
VNEEMTEHLGYEKHDPAGAGTGNIRNGTRSKTVLTENTGPVEIDVPRDRAGTFEPQILKKRQRRLNGVDEVVLSLYAKGLTTGEISAHFAEIYGASVSKETISRITDKLIEEMNDWAVPPARLHLRGRVHRRDRGQGQRRAGRQPALLRGDRRHAGRRAGHPRALGRHRR